MVFACLRAGLLRMWNAKRMILIYFLTNFIFGLLIMLPLRASLNSFLDSSLMGRRLAGTINMDFVFEFIKHTPSIGGVLMSMLVVVSLLYWGINLFLSGGALAVFIQENEYKRERFWGSAAWFFGRFLRLFLWGIPVFALLFSVQFIFLGLEKLIFGSDAYESVLYWSKWLRTIVRYLGIVVFLIIFDYARIYVVDTDIRSMGRAIWYAVRFTFTHLRRTFTLAFTFSLVGTVYLLIYNPVADLMSAPSLAVVLMLFLWQQLYMLVRMVIRLGLYASEVELHGGLLKLAEKKKESGPTSQPAAGGSNPGVGLQKG